MATKTPRILVVDDEPHIQEMLREILMLKNYEIEVANNGKEALEIIEANSADLSGSRETEFDVIITDIMMPQMNGFELLKAVKLRYPQIPVIMVTAYSTVYTMQDALRAGALAYIIKPFKLDHVYQVVAKALSQSAWNRAREQFASA